MSCEMSVATRLIRKLEANERGNDLDIEIEIALFKPDADYVSVRPNSAGTKLIYTKADGTQETVWARDWSLRPATSIGALRSLPNPQVTP